MVRTRDLLVDALADNSREVRATGSRASGLAAAGGSAVRTMAALGTDHCCAVAAGGPAIPWLRYDRAGLGVDN